VRKTELFYATNNNLTGAMPDTVCSLRKTTLQHLSADCITIEGAAKNYTVAASDEKVNCFCCTACVAASSS